MKNPRCYEKHKKTPKKSIHLNDYPDFNATYYLRTGFTKGFQLNYTVPRIHVTAKNIKLSVEHHGSPLDKVNKEIVIGRILSSFLQLPTAYLKFVPYILGTGFRLVPVDFLGYAIDAQFYIDK